MSPKIPLTDFGTVSLPPAENTLALNTVDTYESRIIPASDRGTS